MEGQKPRGHMSLIGKTSGEQDSHKVEQEIAYDTIVEEDVDIDRFEQPRRVRGSKPARDLTSKKTVRLILVIITSAIEVLVIVLSFLGWILGHGLEWSNQVLPVASTAWGSSLAFYFGSGTTGA